MTGGAGVSAIFSSESASELAPARADLKTKQERIAALKKEIPTMLVAHAIEAGLLEGLPASTPVAIVQHASLPQQRQALTTLGQLQATLAREGLQSPSIIVVGDVVQGARAWQAQTAATRHAA